MEKLLFSIHLATAAVTYKLLLHPRVVFGRKDQVCPKPGRGSSQVCSSPGQGLEQPGLWKVWKGLELDEL